MTRAGEKPPCRVCKGAGKVFVGGIAVFCGCRVTPGPWALGRMDRGHGHESFAALDGNSDVIMELGTHGRNARMVVQAVNEHLKARPWRRCTTKGCNGVFPPPKAGVASKFCVSCRQKRTKRKDRAAYLRRRERVYNAGG